jgi:exonuclease III
MSDVHWNPGPSNSQCSDFVFLQFNVNGIRSCSAELASFLINRNIKIACLQESKLSNKSKTPSFPGYAVIRRDQAVGGGGGLITLVHASIYYTNFDTSPFESENPNIELLAICVDMGDDKKINIFNVYIPPASAINFQPVF